MNPFSKIAFLVALAVAVAGIRASASTIDSYTITDPLKGGEYSLELTSLGGDRYSATITIDFSTVPLEIPATMINEVDFKVANSYDDPILVTSAPDSTGNWVAMSGPLTGSGCSGQSDGFICLSAITPLVIGSTQSFSWTVEFGATDILPTYDQHIGARYTSPTKTRGWVVSLTAIPEPASGLLFGAGLMIVGAATRKRLD